MAASRRIIMVGIAGVGKTTLLDAVLRLLQSKGMTAKVISFGTAMLDEARLSGTTDRDALRHLPAGEQERLQRIAAERIAAMDGDLVIVDTHAFVNTRFGYYPGLPKPVLSLLRPTSYISVSAKPEEIYRRRVNDATRHRDRVSVSDIKQEMGMQSAMVSACAVLSGSPVKMVMNRDGEVEKAANDVIRATGLNIS